MTEIRKANGCGYGGGNRCGTDCYKGLAKSQRRLPPFTVDTVNHGLGKANCGKLYHKQAGLPVQKLEHPPLRGQGVEISQRARPFPEANSRTWKLGEPHLFGSTFRFHSLTGLFRNHDLIVDRDAGPRGRLSQPTPFAVQYALASGVMGDAGKAESGNGKAERAYSGRGLTGVLFMLMGFFDFIHGQGAGVGFQFSVVICHWSLVTGHLHSNPVLSPVSCLLFARPCLRLRVQRRRAWRPIPRERRGKVPAAI